MSLVVTLYVREGIVMASDSRITLDSEQPSAEGPIVHLAVGQSDSTYKTFVTGVPVGISTCGQAALEGAPISGFIESFVNDVANKSMLTVDQTALALLQYFQQFSPTPRTTFQVAGYLDGPPPAQRVWSVDVGSGTTTQVIPEDKYGVVWAGEADILARLVNELGQAGPGNSFSPLPYYQIPWQFFTLQDAIDFTVFAIRSTTDALRFQPRPKTVGGPIDVLVIKPTGATWIQRKELRVT